MKIITKGNEMQSHTSQLKSEQINRTNYKKPNHQNLKKTDYSNMFAAGRDSGLLSKLIHEYLISGNYLSVAYEEIKFCIIIFN